MYLLIAFLSLIGYCFAGLFSRHLELSNICSNFFNYFYLILLYMISSFSIVKFLIMIYLDYIYCKKLKFKNYYLSIKTKYNPYLIKIKLINNYLLVNNSIISDNYDPLPVGPVFLLLSACCCAIRIIIDYLKIDCYNFFIKIFIIVIISYVLAFILLIIFYLSFLYFLNRNNLKANIWFNQKILANASPEVMFKLRSNLDLHINLGDMRYSFYCLPNTNSKKDQTTSKK
jgi:hypothetical protein